MTNASDLSQLLCGSVLGVGGGVARCKSAIGPLLDALGLRTPPGAPPAAGLPAPAAAQPPTVHVPSSGVPLLDGLLAALTGSGR
jgi:hypothetical protein